MGAPSLVRPVLHRAAADEDCWNIDADGAHHHSGHDFVAVGNAHDSVELVSLEHRFNGVGDQFSTWKRVSHPFMAHGDSVIDCDCVEFERDSARPLELLTSRLR